MPMLLTVFKILSGHIGKVSLAVQAVSIGKRYIVGLVISLGKAAGLVLLFLLIILSSFLNMMDQHCQ